MLNHIYDLFNYRRFIWNQSLGLWNEKYDASIVMNDKTLRPNERSVRNELVHNKQDWQYNLYSRVLQQTVNQLSKAWSNYFNPKMINHKRPKFKSKKNYKPTFTTDYARLIGGKLFLDKPKTISKKDWFGIKLLEPIRFNGDLKLVTITEKADGLYASFMIDTTHNIVEPLTSDVCGVDVNVKRFNYNDGIVDVVPDKLISSYNRITHYQKILARKRVANPRNFRTKRYTKVKTKLRREYQKVSNIQMDIVHKFTHMLVTNYSEIHIEDLNVSAMQMSKKMGKNLHRSMFGKFSEIIKYKTLWNERDFVLVDRFYPSTQICSNCGYRKTKDSYGGKMTLSGDSIYRQHQTYRCYECGTVIDRDENAVRNIINYGLA